MGAKSEEFRAKARELEERAKNIADPQARATLLETAERWRKLARAVLSNDFERS